MNLPPSKKWKAPQNLKNIQHLVTLEADQKSTVITMDKDDYMEEVHYTEDKKNPDPPHLSQSLMRITDDLLESAKTDKTMHQFL